MSERIKTAILFSGRGSNMQALINAGQDNDYPAAIACVITDNPQASGITFARESGVLCEIIDPSRHTSKQAFEERLQDCLQYCEVELICLAGFMRILSANFVAKWPGRIINIHPSLLPDYKGLDTHARVLRNGDVETGCSVHYVDSGIDTGKIIAQKKVPVYPGDDVDGLAQRVRASEHGLYPATLAHVAHRLLHERAGNA